jgi:hypothetical protein
MAGISYDNLFVRRLKRRFTDVLKDVLPLLNAFA